MNSPGLQNLWAGHERKDRAEERKKSKEGKRALNSAGLQDLWAGHELKERAEERKKSKEGKRALNSANSRSLGGAQVETESRRKEEE